MATVGLMACGPEPEPELTVEALGASTEQSLEGSACRPTSEPVVGSGLNQTCTGPWEYRDLCFKSGSSSACGNPIGYQPATCNKTCNHPTVFQAQTHGGTASGVYRSTRTCDYSEKPPCETVYKTTFSKSCDGVANDLVTTLRSQGKEFASRPLTIVSATPGARTYGATRVITNTSTLYITETNFTETCTVVIDNVGLNWVTNADPLCGTESCNGAPIYSTCRDASFGTEPNPATCDGLPGKGVKYSQPGLTPVQVDPSQTVADFRQDGSLPNRPLCLTADEIPFSNAQAKYNALQTQWNRVASLPTAVDQPVQRRALVDAFKVLFELQGHQLTVPQQDFILQRYGDYPDFNRVTRVDATVDFDWSLGSPSNAIAPETFSARWTGEVLAPVTGTYVFETTADDGVRLWVNDTPLVDKWFPQSATSYSGSIVLQAGQRYALRMEYFENGNAAVARLRWTPPGATGLVVVPSSQLFLTGSATAHGLRAEYFDDLNLTSSNCNAWAPPASSETCTATSTVDATLALCHRMAQSHVPTDRVATVWQRCMDAATSAAAVSCPGTSAYPQAWYDISQALLRKDVVALQRDSLGKLQQDDLQKRLSRLNQWYSLARTTVHGGAAAPPALVKDLDATFSDFWKAAYSGGLLSNDGTQLLSADPFNTGLTTDRALLTAALTPMSGSTSLPLGNAPLLMLMGDGLKGLHDRITDFSQMHDLGCRFMGCAGPSPVRTEVSELWRLMGTLADETALDAAVLGASNLALAPTDRAAWRGLFEKVRQNHGALRTAVKEVFGAATYDKALLLTTPPALVPQPALLLSRAIQDGDARTASYVKTGGFLPSARNSLRNGIQETKRTQLDDLITQRTQELTTAKAEFIQYRTDYVNARLAEMGNAQQVGSILDQLKLRYAEFDQLSLDLVGLRANAASEEAAFGDFASAFKTASDSEQADLAKLAITRGPVDTLSISAEEARFTPWSGSTDLTSFAVRKNGAAWTLAANAGDIINVAARNQWAPTCVLSHAQLRKPMDAAGTLEGVQVNGALTGPEGFLVQFSDSAFTAESNATSKYAGASASARACAGVRVESGVGWDFMFVAKAVAYAYAEACISGEIGIRASSDSSSGGDQRVSATYNTGIRLDGTPFPKLPAGSLLLVQREKVTQVLRDVQVVQPNMSVIIGRKAGLTEQQVDPGVDLYLVANDAASVLTPFGTQSCTPDTSHSLSVDVQRLVPAGTAVRQMAPAMARVITDMRAATESLVNQGRVLSQDMVARRQAATSSLYEACRSETQCQVTGTCNSVCDLTQFPPSLMSLYDTFVAKELARLERKVEIRAVERRMELASMEMKALSNALEATQVQGRILRLVPAWSLRNLDGEKLRLRTQNLASLVTDSLYPLLDLRYPFVLSGLRTNQAISNLVRADWSQAYVNLADLELAAVTAVTGALADGRLADKDPSYTLVALSFPRPGYPATASPWLKASPERSKALWDSLMDVTNPKAAFSVQVVPSDFYVDDGGISGALQCTEGTPILHRVGLFIVRTGGTAGAENTTLNGQPLRAASTFEQELTFTGPQGTKTYFIEDDLLEGPRWRLGQNRIHFGLSAAAVSTFELGEFAKPVNDQSSGGDGLSPFSTVKFDVTGLRTNPIHPLDAASELVLVYKVDRRTVSSMPDPLICQ
ncbi:PA14 domain-containing protein [Corallococcus llansteffanensis]|nr:PA14 domain-containing protein [Corallococcus llansteffanensis]